MRADCVFDVSVTGFTGFADTYVLTQQRRPDATETTVKGDRDFTTYGENVTFTATVAQTVSRGAGAPTGTAQFILDGGKVGNPILLDANSRALWSSSGLQVGQHQIVAQYIPTGWGPFIASTSPQVSHTVVAAGYHLYFWLIILLLIITVILIAFLIWRSLRESYDGRGALHRAGEPWQLTSNRKGRGELATLQSGGLVKEAGLALIHDCGYIVLAPGLEATMAAVQNRDGRYERHIR